MGANLESAPVSAASLHHWATADLAELIERRPEQRDRIRAGAWRGKRVVDIVLGKPDDGLEQIRKFSMNATSLRVIPRSPRRSNCPMISTGRPPLPLDAPGDRKHPPILAGDPGPLRRRGHRSLHPGRMRQGSRRSSVSRIPNCAADCAHAAALGRHRLLRVGVGGPYVLGAMRMSPGGSSRQWQSPPACLRTPGTRHPPSTATPGAPIPPPPPAHP